MIYIIFIHLLYNVLQIGSFEYPPLCKLKAPDVNPRDCSIYTKIPRKLEFFSLIDTMPFGARFGQPTFGTEQCKRECINDKRCYAVHHDTKYDKCATYLGFPVKLAVYQESNTYVIACCEPKPEDLSNFIPTNCKKSTEMSNLRTCYLSINRKLEMTKFPDKILLSDYYKTENDLKVCIKSCRENLDCIAFSLHKRNNNCRYYAQPANGTYIGKHPEYDSYVFMCCFFNLTRDNLTSQFDDPTCVTYLSDTRTNCKILPKRYIKWFKFKAVVPRNDSLSKLLTRINETECKEYCLQHGECSTIVSYENNGFQYCEVHVYNKKYVSTTYVYSTHIVACCGAVPSPDELLCESEDTNPGFTCHKFCRERFLQCQSITKLGCQDLCGRCLEICKKGMPGS